MDKKSIHRRLPSGRNVIAFGALFLYGILGYSVAVQANQAGEVGTPAPASVSYARVADLVLASPAVANIRVRSINSLKPDRAPDVQPGRARFYVSADTLGLIRADGVISRRVAFLLDGSATNARRPGLKGQMFLAFGRVGAQVDQFQLTSSTALIPWSPSNEALVRRVIADVTDPNVPPAITGINSAFHVSGSILGEGESQIFLETADGSPISLSVIRRPGEQPHYSVSLGEIVDEAATIPERDTLLWYRLACGLPTQLPALALSDLARADAEAANRDYSAFREMLGSCDRTAMAVL